MATYVLTPDQFNKFLDNLEAKEYSTMGNLMAYHNMFLGESYGKSKIYKLTPENEINPETNKPYMGIDSSKSFGSVKDVWSDSSTYYIVSIPEDSPEDVKAAVPEAATPVPKGHEVFRGEVLPQGEWLKSILPKDDKESLKKWGDAIDFLDKERGKEFEQWRIDSKKLKDLFNSVNKYLKNIETREGLEPTIGKYLRQQEKKEKKEGEVPFNIGDLSIGAAQMPGIDKMPPYYPRETTLLGDMPPSKIELLPHRLGTPSTLRNLPHRLGTAPPIELLPHRLEMSPIDFERFKEEFSEKGFSEKESTQILTKEGEPAGIITREPPKAFSSKPPRMHLEISDQYLQRLANQVINPELVKKGGEKKKGKV